MGPTKVLYDPSMSGVPSKACGNVSGLDDTTYRDVVLQPWKDSHQLSNIFLVNNDWICMNVHKFYGDWAEESLLQAERTMYLLNKTSKPTWLNSTYYKTRVTSQVAVETFHDDDDDDYENTSSPLPQPF